jgi:large subunit ribosomal protein L32
MAVPKRKTSSSKRDKRRSHHSVSPPNVTTCTQCGEPSVMHRACPHCGTYRGRKVIDVESD